MSSSRDGCKRALRIEDEACLYSTLMIKCQPVKIQFRKTGNKSAEKNMYGLFHRDLITDISKELQFDANTRSTIITANIQLSVPYLKKIVEIANRMIN